MPDASSMRDSGPSCDPPPDPNDAAGRDRTDRVPHNAQSRRPDRSALQRRLKWSDLDRTSSRLSISRTLQNVGGRPVEFGCKTRTSRRTVELDRQTTRQLDRWRRRLRRDGLPHGPDDWMFCNARGRFLNPESVSQLFDRIVRRSGLPHIRFHDLRHTHASLLVAAGVPLKVVSERLGHAHPAFTMHTYQHLLPGMSAAAAEQLATLIAT